MKNEKTTTKPAFDPEVPPVKVHLSVPFVKRFGLDEERGKITSL